MLEIREGSSEVLFLDLEVVGRSAFCFDFGLFPPDEIELLFRFFEVRWLVELDDLAHDCGVTEVGVGDILVIFEPLLRWG